VSRAISTEEFLHLLADWQNEETRAQLQLGNL
jgi:hypothetical protein